MAENMAMISKIRLRRDLHARLVKSAKITGRTLSAEIAEHLERSIGEENHAVGDDFFKDIRAIFAEESARILGERAA